MSQFRVQNTPSAIPAATFIPINQHSRHTAAALRAVNSFVFSHLMADLKSCLIVFMILDLIVIK